MKPLKLKMTAFGPYKECETIDFRELGDRGLFAISGPTGSGKTSIFDAICYALYGKASGEEREDRSLRSDFADDQVHTEVELWFESAGDTYRIMRRMPHVKAGNKSATGDRIELFRIDGESEKPVTDRQMTTEVNAKVAELIGFSHDQFSQIVMLPQGEFRKLLTSDTENKEKIFRKIFRTKKYKDMEAVLKERKSSVEAEWKKSSGRIAWQARHLLDTLPDLSEELAASLSDEHPNAGKVIEGLFNEQERRTAETEQLAKEVEEREVDLTGANRRLSLAEELNTRLEEWEEKKRQMSELNKRLPEMEDKRRAVTLARLAARIRPAEEKLAEAEQEQQQAIKAVEQADQTLAATQQAEAEAAARSSELREQDTLIDAKRREAERLEEARPRLHEREQALQDLTTAEAGQNRLLEETESLRTDAGKLRDRQESLREDISALEAALAGTDELHERLTSAERDGELLAEHLRLQETVRKTAENSERDARLKEEAESMLQRLKQQLQDSQAAALAAHLHDGSPCPVCGSAEHPAPARSADGPDAEELEVAEAAFLKAQSDAISSAGALKIQNGLLEQSADRLHGRGLEASDAADLLSKREKEAEQLRIDIAAAKSRRNRLASMRKDEETLRLKADEVAAKLAQLTEELAGTSSRIASLKATIAGLEQSIPEGYDNVRSLDASLSELRNQIGKHDRLKEQLEAAATKASDKRKAAEQSLSFARSQKEKAEKRLVEAAAAFQEKLAASTFNSSEAYRTALMPDHLADETEAAIRAFENDLHAVKLRENELAASLEGNAREYLDGLRKLAEDTKAAFEQAQERLIHSRNTLNTIKKGIAAMREAATEAEALEKKLGKVAGLHDLIRGQNADKLSFERYLQIEYLERILLAANERLKDLSNGQFELLRSDRQEARGRQSGLGIDVYDAYTGQARDVRTLSGGEKFNASLSLALGMADVIQGFGGNIRVDTMFIDEGFGSLDPESLQKAIEALVGLQRNGRVVGVISHVEELKSAMPAVLKVTKSKAGHSSTEFVLK
ncbi:AAA family ATPase [Bhargavaea massiliensis]|uniref:AAA family ATPase n=1 Tax=Bhargavaea massiliensis TaxID=2697500 RepID=UPI001BCF02A1|nr:SMC family ATPase [Bhargavaea massiliensis]